MSGMDFMVGERQELQVRCVNIGIKITSLTNKAKHEA